VRYHSALWIAALAGDVLVASSSRAQTAVPPDHTATYRADSLRLSGRPWHAAETLLAAARRDPNPNAFLICEGAKAEVHAKRYEHARTLLVGQPWLLDYLDGEALAVLAQAELGVGRFAEAAAHFQMARARAPAGRVPLLAVRAGVAFDAAGQADSAAAAFAAARAGGKLASIDNWLRVRQARVTRDTASAGQLLADLPAPAARDVPVARARSLLLAGDTTRALEAFATAGKEGSLDATRLALATGDSARARTLADDLDKRFPEDTIVRFNYLPTLRAQLALNTPNGAAKAVEALAAASPYELGVSGDSTFWTNLYPIYVRGQALLASRQGTQAAVEFQKILDWPGVVVNEPIGALAHLGLARSYALAGDAAKSRAAYNDFFTLWKDADPDIPVLIAAKSEAAKLQ